MLINFKWRKNMKNNQKNFIYESFPERELIKMWEDIEERNLDRLNRSLMKAIGKNEQEEAAKVGQEEPLYRKRMWDTEKGEWVPFSLWGAHFIVNERKEPLVLQIWRPVDIQPEYGPTLKGWCSIDSSYLTEALKEKEIPSKYIGNQSFREIIKQDYDELKGEGRYDEIPGYRSKKYI